MYQKISGEGMARRGVVTTRHGHVETPAFMPVATQASVKGIDVARLEEAGAGMVLVNTYHLMLRPGEERVRELGGIQRFMGWKGPVLSDSGGFQVFSLSAMRKVSEEGVRFRSHVDGSYHVLTPERAVGVQEALGVDVAMAFDECPAATLGRSEVEESLALTVRWARRCMAARTRASETALFGITQGGRYPDLRKRSAEQLGEMGFDGTAIGGVSVGESKEVMYDILSYHPAELPEEKARYLMGVGTPRDIVEAVKNGVDLFDCVMPTRSGRFGRAFTRGPEPYVNIRNSRWATSGEPLDERCRCVACARYSRAYLRHLFVSGEMLGPQLLSLHNVTHYLDLMAAVRTAVASGTFGALYKEMVDLWG